MENNALQLKELSTGLIAIMTNPETAREFERSLTIESIVQKAIPISELRRVVGSRQVGIALDVQLTRLVANLNLKWTLNDSQIKTIVEDLLDKYPNETLEDFILCFKKARLGEYGELIRLDSAIVFTWMTSYLTEKYTVIEAALMKEKDDHYKIIIPESSDRDWLAEWQKAVNENNGMKKVPDLEEDEIQTEGQPTPKRKVHPYNESEAEIRLREHHERIFAGQEMTVRARHPEFTEEQIKARCKELQEQVIYEETKPKHTLPAIEKIWRPKKKFKKAI